MLSCSHSYHMGRLMENGEGTLRLSTLLSLMCSTLSTEEWHVEYDIHDHGHGHWLMKGHIKGTADNLRWAPGTPPLFAIVPSCYY